MADTIDGMRVGEDGTFYLLVDVGRYGLTAYAVAGSDEPISCNGTAEISLDLESAKKLRDALNTFIDSGTTAGSATSNGSTGSNGSNG
ncbi:MAG: hypothetical protein WC488_05200 [Candidatus Micrarchaeia archaeon]